MTSFSGHGGPRAAKLQLKRGPSWSTLRPACDTAGARHSNDADHHRGGGRLDFGTSIVVAPRPEVGEKAKRPAR
jgi:hypothetical protein